MKTSEATKENSILVRTIVAATDIKFPTDIEKRFQDSCFRKGLESIPVLEIGHILRLHEALCAVEFASPAALDLREGLMKALGRHHNLRVARRPVAVAAPAGRAAK